jgi:type VI secretion system secreted protein VgrG
MQRLASCAMGRQFIPRVGQSVLVDFVDGQIQRPIVIAALYDGQGEAGTRPTPGGVASNAGPTPSGLGAGSDATAPGQSSDHRPSTTASVHVLPQSQECIPSSLRGRSRVANKKASQIRDL